MTPLTLTPHELADLTGRVRAHAQLRWLLANGFEARRRADGSVAVAREHALQRMGARLEQRAERGAPFGDDEPDLSAYDVSTP